LLEGLCSGIHDIIPALSRYQIEQLRMTDARCETPGSGVGATLSVAAGCGEDVHRASDALQAEGRQRAADEAFVE
jgi:hypothetical protein